MLPSLVIVADSARSRDTARVGVGEVTGAGSTAGVIQSRVGHICAGVRHWGWGWVWVWV